MTADAKAQAANRAFLDRETARLPELRDRINRTLLIELHSRGIVSVDDIYRQARALAKGEGQQPADLQADNVQVGRRWDEEEKSLIQELVWQHAASAFTQVEIADLVNLTHKREEAHSLEEIANLPAVSFGLLSQKVKSFCRLPTGHTRLSATESMSARVALIRRFISDQLEFIGVAKHYFRIRDFDDLVDRIIGSEEGIGLIGGKAGGMLLGAKILAHAGEEDPAAPTMSVHTPESFFLRSDVIEDFIQYNGLQHLQDQKYKTSEEITNEFPMILELLKNTDFPPPIAQKIRLLLAKVGSHPLIVRSSSLLEDRFGTAFAGKYRSVFISNQGTEQERLNELLGAITEVYASTFHPDPISYRRRHNLIDFSEDMGVLIQKLVGRRIGPYFFPVWSGVGFSHNLYRRNPRVRPEDGLARIVFGLGTRAVDRVGADFPRMIPLGFPTLRAEVQTADLVQVSQKQVDVIDLESRAFTSLPLANVLGTGETITGLNQVMSSLEHGFLRPLMGDTYLGAPADLVVTFDRFTQASPFPALLRWSLQTLENAYGCPVDVEFASDGDKFYLLQCRPQPKRQPAATVRLPAAVPAARRIFTAHQDIMSGYVQGIEYIVLVDPRDYNALTSDDQRVGVAQVIRQVNQVLQGKNFILMGPGRWGSRDLRLGIRVGYADINNASVLIEIARQQDGYLPEVSFGSHFFQDLMESGIRYLALYPDKPETVFNDEFLHGAPNVLADLVPAATGFSHVIRVLHVPAAAAGQLLNLAMDGDNQQALGWLASPENAAH